MLVLDVLAVCCGVITVDKKKNFRVASRSRVESYATLCTKNHGRRSSLCWKRQLIHTRCYAAGELLQLLCRHRSSSIFAAFLHSSRVFSRPPVPPPLLNREEKAAEGGAIRYRKDGGIDSEGGDGAPAEIYWLGVIDVLQVRRKTKL